MNEQNWIKHRIRKANLYFHPNNVSFDVKDRKAKKTDITSASTLHVDVDDLSPESLQRLKTYKPTPTAILNSGGGYHAYWHLKEPCLDLDRVEQANIHIANAVGGDHCHNVDRILRLPGTLNIPSDKKRAAGRETVLVRVLEADWSRQYDIADFPSGSPSPAAPSISLVDPTLIVGVDMDILPSAVSTDIRKLIESGDDFEHPLGSATPHYKSRSEAVFRAICALAQAGCSQVTIAGILINPKYGISASILEKKNPIQYALRQAKAAIAAVSDGWPDVDRNGKPRPTMRSAMVALTRLGLDFSHDLFSHRKRISGVILEEDDQGEISDDICLTLRGMILNEFGFDPRSEHVRDAVTLLCLEKSYHPIRDMLDSLVWDQEPRIKRWLTIYAGAEETDLNAAIGSIFLIAAVRRARRPGIKFDQIMVLEGPQGSGKSSLLSILAGPDNHSDQEILTQDAKTQMELMEGVWIYELGEVEGLNRAEVNKIKAFASRTADRSRMAYARFAAVRPRQSVFVGTTNDETYLRDQTGNRRFWPVKTGTIDLNALKRDRDQIWAEAAYLEEQGASITLPEDLWEAAAVKQAARLEDDPWIDVLISIRGKACGDVVRIQTITLLAGRFGIPLERQTQGHTKRLAVILRKLGWQQTKYRVGGNTVRGYERAKPENHIDDPEVI